MNQNINDCDCSRCVYLKQTYPNDTCSNCKRPGCESINFSSLYVEQLEGKCKCWMCLDCVREAMLLNHFQFWNSKKIEQCPRCHENIEEFLHQHFVMDMNNNSQVKDMFPADVVEEAEDEHREIFGSSESEDCADCPECVRLRTLQEDE